MITKKYIFEQKLKGERLILTAGSHAEWYEIIKTLCQNGILHRINRANISKEVRDYIINYPITINNIGMAKFTQVGRSVFLHEKILQLLNCDRLKDDDDCA